MSIAGRLRDLFRERLGAFVDSDTTLDDYEEEAPPQSSALRSRPPIPARTVRRVPSQPPAASRPLLSSLPTNPARIAELYRLFELPVGTDLAIVRKSYRRLLRLHHPDLAGPERGSTERAQELIEAYSELCSLLP